jgi:hypothetical protein
MKQENQDFPEVKGKIIEKVELSVESGYYAISVRCTDKTALNFTIESCVVAFPTYQDWTDGEGKTLKEYAPVQSRLSLETEDDTEARLDS